MLSIILVLPIWDLKMAFIDNIDFIPNSKNPKFGLLSVLKCDDLKLEYLT